MSIPKTVKGRLNVYYVSNSGIIDYHLLNLISMYKDKANGDWGPNTLDQLWDIRREQDILLDARLEVMGVR